MGDTLQQYFLDRPRLPASVSLSQLLTSIYLFLREYFDLFAMSSALSQASESGIKKKFGKNLNKLSKPPPQTTQPKTASSRNGMLLLSTKRSSSSNSASGLLSKLSAAAPPPRPFNTPSLKSENGGNDVSIKLVPGSSSDGGVTWGSNQTTSGSGAGGGNPAASTISPWTANTAPSAAPNAVNVDFPSSVSAAASGPVLAPKRGGSSGYGSSYPPSSSQLSYSHDEPSRGDGGYSTRQNFENDHNRRGSNDNHFGTKGDAMRHDSSDRDGFHRNRYGYGADYNPNSSSYERGSVPSLSRGSMYANKPRGITSSYGVSDEPAPRKVEERRYFEQHHRAREPASFIEKADHTGPIENDISQELVMNKLAKERAQAKREEEERKSREQKERAAARLKELEDRIASKDLAPLEKPMKHDVPAVKVSQSEIVLEKLGRNGSTLKESVIHPEHAPHAAKTLFDPNRSYSSLVGGVKNKLSNGATNSSQPSNSTTPPPPPITAHKPPFDELPVKPIVLASYEDRNRGERPNQGPRMLFDPKSGSMVEARSLDKRGEDTKKKERNRERKEKIKKERERPSTSQSVVKTTPGKLSLVKRLEGSSREANGIIQDDSQPGDGPAYLGKKNRGRRDDIKKDKKKDSRSISRKDPIDNDRPFSANTEDFRTSSKKSETRRHDLPSDKRSRQNVERISKGSRNTNSSTGVETNGNKTKGSNSEYNQHTKHGRNAEKGKPKKGKSVERQSASAYSSQGDHPQSKRGQKRYDNQQRRDRRFQDEFSKAPRSPPPETKPDEGHSPVQQPVGHFINPPKAPSSAILSDGLSILDDAPDTPTLQATAHPWAPSRATLAAIAVGVSEKSSPEVEPSSGPGSSSKSVGDESKDSPSFTGLGFDPTENMATVIMSPAIQGTDIVGDFADLSLDQDVNPFSSGSSRGMSRFFGGATWGSGALNGTPHCDRASSPGLGGEPLSMSMGLNWNILETSPSNQKISTQTSNLAPATFLSLSPLAGNSDDTWGSGGFSGLIGGSPGNDRDDKDH